MWKNYFLENLAVYNMMRKNYFLENRAIYNNADKLFLRKSCHL
jgi:hypothetical protein